MFNLFEQRPADRLFPAGTATNTAYIARVPFDSGSLIGHWIPQTYDRWEPGSVPHTLFRGDRFAQTLQRVEELKKACAPDYPRLAEAAMRYTLGSPEVKTVIPGMASTSDVEANVAYSDGAPFPTGCASSCAATSGPGTSTRDQPADTTWMPHPRRWNDMKGASTLYDLVRAVPE